MTPIPFSGCYTLGGGGVTQVSEVHAPSVEACKVGEFLECTHTALCFEGATRIGRRGGGWGLVFVNSDSKYGKLCNSAHKKTCRQILFGGGGDPSDNSVICILGCQIWFSPTTKAYSYSPSLLPSMKKTNSVALSLQANYTGWATANFRLSSHANTSTVLITPAYFYHPLQFSVECILPPQLLQHLPQCR
jgi:hypothetical protein